jgi:hypothetical protein
LSLVTRHLSLCLCVYGELGASPGFGSAEQCRCVLDAYRF